MSNIEKVTAGDIITILNGGSDLVIPKPFERDIFLFKTYIAGTKFVDGITEHVKDVAIDTRLDFFREPDNEHDNRAIVVKNKAGEKLGYVPKKDNVIFSRLMDSGKLLFGKVDEITVNDGKVNIVVGIYLNE